MSITVFGSVNLDLTVYVNVLPRPGETVHADRQITGLGGKGANQAVAATKLSTGKVRFVSAVGKDAFAQTIRAELASYGVDMSDIATFDDVATGNALIHVDKDSQNTITVVGGANMAWPDTGPDASVFADAKVAVFQLETPLPTTLAAMKAAKQCGATVVLDPAPVPHSAIDALLAQADVVTPNETEAEALTGIRPHDEASALEAAAALLAKGPELAVVKLGANGLYFATRDGQSGFCPPFKVNAVDTVAAGDCFCGALAVALGEGMDTRTALRFASGAGALAATKYGAAASAPDRADLDRLMID
ncbi:ribokinase [Thalassospira sp. MA62]|nr:ribokinase [Thalassospira sp. MA62]